MSVIVSFATTDLDEQLITEDLAEAANKLMTASDADFKRLQEEQWYKRLVDRLTFTDTKGKRVAAQINSLMQAQICVIKVMAGLSGRIRQVFDLLKTHADKIDRLAQGSVELTRMHVDLKGRIRALEENCWGISRTSDFRELPEKGKSVLVAVLDALAGKFGGSASEEQRRYLHWVHENCHGGLRITSASDHIKAYEMIDAESQRKLIVTSCLIYIFLRANDDNLDEADKFISGLDVGPKKLTAIKKDIEDWREKYGVEAFMPRGFDQGDNEWEEDFDEDVKDLFEQVDEQREAVRNFYDPGMPREKLILRDSFTIAAGRVERYLGKDVEIHAKIICHGSMEFHDCHISYGTHNDGIVYLGEDANVSFVNSKLERVAGEGVSSWGNASRGLFQQEDGKEKQKIVVSGCALINCAGVAKLGGANLDIDRCYLKGCGEIFDYNSSHTEYNVRRSVVLMGGTPAWGDNGWYHLSMDKAIFSECLLYGNNQPETRKAFLLLGRSETALQTRGGKFKDCQLYGISRKIDGADSFSNCNFIVCQDLFFGGSPSFFECNFLACKKVSSYGRNYEVRDSYFYACQDIIEDAGGLSMDLCEFFNASASEYPSVIGFTEGKNVIKRTTFDGFDSRKKMIVDFSFKKDECKIVFEDCSFKNTPNAKRKAIQQKGEYKDWGGIIKKDIFPVSFNNACNGLELKSNNYLADDIKVRAKSIAGKPIGTESLPELIKYATCDGFVIPEKQKLIHDVLASGVVNAKWLAGCLGWQEKAELEMDVQETLEPEEKNLAIEKILKDVEEEHARESLNKRQQQLHESRMAVLVFLSHAWFTKVAELTTAAGNLKLIPVLAKSILNITVTGTELGNVDLSIHGGRLEKGHNDLASTTLIMSSENFKAFLELDMSAMKACINGRIKAVGDVIEYTRIILLSSTEMKVLYKQILALA